jgi:hypothetical protein
MRISFGAAVREPMPGTSGLPASTLSDILLRRLNTLSIRTQRSSARIGAATIVAALLASLFAFIAPADAAQVVTVTRTSGPDRYATAAAVALADFPVAERPVANVILASGENYPDGLAASSLAGAANAPVLLTQTNSLPAVTASALASLQPTTVHIVGGTAAVSAGVRAQLTGLGYTLNEIGGPTRYETAALISQFMRTTVAPVGTFGGQRTAIIATGLNWPDALAGGAPAAAGNHPILLTGNTLHPATSAELTAASHPACDHPRWYRCGSGLRRRRHPGPRHRRHPCVGSHPLRDCHGTGQHPDDPGPRLASASRPLVCSS